MYNFLCNIFCVEKAFVVPKYERANATGHVHLIYTQYQDNQYKHIPIYEVINAVKTNMQ